jgi:hypothetical protein
MSNPCRPRDNSPKANKCARLWRQAGASAFEPLLASWWSALSRCANCLFGLEVNFGGRDEGPGQT